MVLRVILLGFISLDSYELSESKCWYKIFTTKTVKLLGSEMDMCDTEDFINEQLIKIVQCYPALHNIDANSKYDKNKNNEVYWDDIQKKIGIHSE